MANKAESTRRRLGELLESARVWGFVALLAIAISFSPRVSAMASWFVLGFAWLVATLTAWTHNQGRVRGRRLLVTGAYATFFGAILVPLGFWLTHSKLAAVEENKVLRSHLHIRSFQPSPMASGKMAMLNVYYRNDGQAPLEMQTFCNVFVAEFPDNLLMQGEREDQLFETMRNRIPPDDSPIPHTTMPVAAERWTTCFGPYLSAQHFRLLQEGKAAIYFVGTMRYRDSAGTHETNFCVLTHTDPAVVFTCQRHNEEP